MILGFTGTRYGCTLRQLDTLGAALRDTRIEQLLHGGCRGADIEADSYALDFGIHREVLPGPGTSCGDMLRDGSYRIRPAAADYLTRNRAIVDEGDGLLACPRESAYPSLRIARAGGTWYTVRYALRTGVPCAIIWPDGAIERAKEQVA